MRDEVRAPSSSIPAAEVIPEIVTVAEIAKNSGEILVSAAARQAR
jgi:hypothetical protein